MKFLKLLPIFFIFLGNFPSRNFVHAEVKNPDEFKVFSSNNKKLSIANVEYYLKKGDDFIENGDLDNAKDAYLDARKLAKQLASFYSDLNTEKPIWRLFLPKFVMFPYLSFASHLVFLHQPL